MRLALRRDPAGDPKETRRLEREAMALRSEDPARAKDLFLAVLAREPNRVSSLRAAGRLDMKGRRFDDALGHWRRLSRIVPDDPEPHVQMGRIHRHAGRHAEAMSEAKIALTLSPHHAAAESLRVRAATRALERPVDGETFAGAFGRRVVALLARLGFRPRYSPVGPPGDRDRSAAALLARAKALGQAGDVDALAEVLQELLARLGPDPRVISVVEAHRAELEQKAAPWLRAALNHAVSRDDGDPCTRLLRRLAADHARGDLAALSRTLEHLGTLSVTDDRALRAILRHGAGVLERLEAQRPLLSAAPLATVEARLIRAYAGQAWFIQQLARQREQTGSARDALATYDTLADSADGAGPALFHAASLACGVGDWDAALAFAQRLAVVAADDRSLVTAVADLPIGHDQPLEAVRFWSAVDALGPVRMWVRLGLIRVLAMAGDHAGVVTAAMRTLEDASPLIDLPIGDHNYLIDIVRRLTQAHGRAAGAANLADFGRSLDEREPPSALRDWILASIDVARLDGQGALQRLDAALAHEPMPAEIALDLHAEKALIHQHYHCYGEAFAEFDQVPRGLLAPGSHYGRRFEQVRDVASLCGDNDAPLRYPECLFDVLLEEAAGGAPSYEALARQVVMVSGSLGQGGGERQTITVVRRILGDHRVAKLSLLVRSTHLRASDDFFLSSVSDLPVDLDVYGRDWQERSDLAGLLPEFASRPRLLAALDLLPHNAREEVARLCRRFIDLRPQAVHIWQDIPHAALACAVVGVPHFFVHRGSLAPDFWEQTEHQTAVHFRPMRHAYRRLLERQGFVILNNSVSGCKTDQEWLRWPDAAPFQVVYNAVDFAQLGPDLGRNVDLRRSLGVADDAPLVGGSFRIVSVKRPLYWIEAARRVREAIPNAHFVIIGDGDMTEEVARYAAEHGFAEAVHLAGRVTNVGDWYRAMDLKLMTSEREGIPNAIIEAQHFGVPIVATDVGGIAEALEVGKTGFVVTGDDGPEPYAERIIEVLSDTSWRAAARREAPAFVHDKFSLDRVVDRLMTYYGIEN